MTTDTIARTIAALRAYCTTYVCAPDLAAELTEAELLRLCDAAEAGLRCPPREPTREMIDAALSVGTGIYIAEKTWRAMWDAAQINEDK